MCPCVGTRTPQCVCGGQKTICGGQFSPSIMWAPGIGLRLPGLLASSFTHRASSTTQDDLNFFWCIFGMSKMKYLFMCKWSIFYTKLNGYGAISSAFTKSSDVSSQRGICPLEHKWHFSMNQISEYQSTECKVSLLGFSTLELIYYNYASARRG